jgi:hypothetical protein
VGDPIPDFCASCGIKGYSNPDSLNEPFLILPTHPRRPLNRAVKRLVALFEILSGSFVVVAAAWFVVTQGITLGWFTVLLQGFAILSIVGGVLLWRDHLLGYELSEILQLLQIIRFQSGWFSFVVAAGPQLLIGYWNGGLNFFAGVGATVTFGASAGPGYVALNVAAIVLFIMIRKGRQSVKHAERTAALPYSPLAEDTAGARSV